MSERRSPLCAIPELGIACALGRSIDEVWPRLLAGDTSGMHDVGAVPGPLPDVPPALADLDCRNNQLAWLAYEQIAASVDRVRARFGAERVGVVVGTSTSGVAAAEAAFRELASAGRLAASFRLGQLEHGGLADFIARVSGATGPGYTISTACSSGAKSLASARALLELGLCDAVIAGGVDSLCQLTVNGFASLQAVATGLTNPMSRHRNGLTLGEGAALFLLTRDPGGVQLAGAGESSDAHHMSAPEPSGRGIETCMRAALDDAGLTPADIAYLNLHGTGTLLNDAVESRVVDRIFGDRVPCSSTKPLVGHTLGASGALEAAFCWMILRRRRADDLLLPPHRWDGERDPELPALALTTDDARVGAPAPAAVMSNSFGFGGSNCSLILQDGPAQ